MCETLLRVQLLCAALITSLNSQRVQSTLIGEDCLTCSWLMKNVAY